MQRSPRRTGTLPRTVRRRQVGAEPRIHFNAVQGRERPIPVPPSPPPSPTSRRRCDARPDGALLSGPCAPDGALGDAPLRAVRPVSRAPVSAALIAVRCVPRFLSGRIREGDFFGSDLLRRMRHGLPSMRQWIGRDPPACPNREFPWSEQKTRGADWEAAPAASSNPSRRPWSSRSSGRSPRTTRTSVSFGDRVPSGTARSRRGARKVGRRFSPRQDVERPSRRAISARQAPAGGSSSRQWVVASIARSLGSGAGARSAAEAEGRVDRGEVRREGVSRPCAAADACEVCRPRRRPRLRLRSLRPGSKPLLPPGLRPC